MESEAARVAPAQLSLAARLNDALPAALAGDQRRRAALHSFAGRGLPTNRDENWRHASLHALHAAQLSPVQQPPGIPADELPEKIPGYIRYTYIDGLFVPELSDAPAAAAEASEEIPPHQGETLADTRLALLNEAYAADTAHIIAADPAHPTCVELLFVSATGADRGASYPRIKVHARAGCRLGLVERHVSAGQAAGLVNGLVNLDIDERALVEHYRLQQTGTEASWFDTLSARIGTDGAYHLYLVNLGARSARSTMQIRLQGARASVKLNTISVTHRPQVHDAFAVVEHAAPDTRTEQRFRGIAAERARAAFVGKVLVRENARGTVSNQSLRGLLAGPQAEIDVRPQLEIYTDEVQCNHGATAGKLDDEMLFYLLTRGVDRDTAQMLLKWAFLEDVIARIGLAQLRRRIEQTLAGQLDGTAGLMDMLQ